MREAPSVTIIEHLLKCGARVAVHDPVAMEEAKKHLGRSVTYCASNYAALRKADALVVVTEWNEFRRPDFDKMKSLMRAAVVFDCRNVYNPAVMREKGFSYYGIGRGAVHGS
jgi:UDPglucose 6-dehydrogenase